jgi:hypothetical protein
MSCPSRQQLRHSNYSEGRMASTQLEILGPQIQCPQFVQVFRPQANEFIQQLPQRLAFALSYVSQTIKGLKCLSFAQLQHHPRARHPIRAVGVN